MRNELRQVMRKKFDTKADQEQTWQGFLGDQFGNIVVPKMANYVYITLTDGTTSIALNKSVPAIVNLPITVGYDPQQAGGKVLEVLAVRNIPRTSAKDSSYHVDGHRASHEWMNPDGGTDVVYTQLRQFMPLRPQTVSGSAFSIYVYPAIQNIGGSWQQVGNVSIDLTSYRPGTQTFVVSGSSLPAVYVLISMNNISGSMIVTSGSAMTIGTLTLANIPVTPANNVPICAVRLYALQTLIQEDRLSTDLVDMRWGLSCTGGGIPEAPNDGQQYGRQSLGWTEITSGSGGGGIDRFIGVYNYCIQTGGQVYQIGLVKGVDERHLTEKVEPILSPGSGWENGGVKDPCLVDVNGVLWVFYAGYTTGTTVFGIGVARSFDGGLTWNKYASNPILTASQSWETTGGSYVEFPCVIYDRSETDASKRWKMWFMGGGSSLGIGYAYSADGLSWTQYASNPVLSITGSGWESQCVQPRCVTKLGDTFYLFYNGYDSASPYIVRGGFATFTDPGGIYTRSPDNPILSPDGIYVTLTSAVSVGDTTLHVDDATKLPIGAAVWVNYITTHYLTKVVSQASSTSIIVADAAPVGITSGGYVRSVNIKTTFISWALYDGGWRFALVGWHPQMDEGGYVREITIWGYSPDLKQIFVDYGAGTVLPFTTSESQNDNVSRENLSLIPIYRDDDRYTKPSSSSSGSGVTTTGVVSNGHLAGFSGSSGNYIYDDEAPQDGNQYARKNAAWVTVTSGSGGSISGSGVITTGAVSDGHLAVFSGSSGNYIKDGGVTPTFEVILKNETLASPAASLIFSSIPTGYSHLRIIISARAVNNDINQASVIFNSDNNVANYFYAETYFGTSTSSAVRSGSDLFAINIAGGNSPTSHFGGGIVDVLEYANTTMTKQAKMDSFARRASSFYGDQQWGYWNSTAAVNRIDITPGSGNFAAGTHWTVIGIKTN